MPSSSPSTGGPTSAFATADLLKAMISGRSLQITQFLSDDYAASIVAQLANFAKTDLSPVAMLIGSNSGDYAQMMPVIDHVRLQPIPVLGVALTSIGALAAALLQNCAWRFARPDAVFNLQLLSPWTEASVTLHARLSQSDARDTLLRSAARMRQRLDAVAAILASRTTVAQSEWAERIKEGRGMSLEEGTRVGLVDAIIE